MFQLTQPVANAIINNVIKMPIKGALEVGIRNADGKYVVI